MPKKRGQDEEVFLFAVKVVGPVAVFFVAAAITDILHVVRWANSGPIDSAMYAVSHVIDSIF